MSQNARIAENAVSAESLATRPRVTFATGLQYNSSVFLAFTIGSTLYNILAFYTFAFATENSLIRGTSFIFASISIASHALSILTLWTIWAVKPDNTKRSFYPAAVKHLPIVQSLFPLLISFALLFRLVATLIVGDCSKFNQSPMMFASFCDPYRSDGGITLRLVVELMFNPILTAFLLRDTPSWALIASWAVAVVIMVTLAIVLQSTDIGVTTAAYVFCSVLVYVDSTRHYKGLMDELAQLQKTLVDNVRQTSQEQTTELKALMGNMAHDLVYSPCERAEWFYLYAASNVLPERAGVHSGGALILGGAGPAQYTAGQRQAGPLHCYQPRSAHVPHRTRTAVPGPHPQQPRGHPEGRDQP